MIGRCAVVLIAVPMLAAAQSSDSAGFTPRGEARIGVVLGQGTRVVASGPAAPARRSLSLRGAQFELRSAGDDAGLSGRYEASPSSGLDGDPSGGRLQYVDGRFWLGPRAFSLVAGYTVRSFVLDTASRSFGLARLGFQSGAYFAGTGVVLNIGGSYVRTPTSSKRDSLSSDGFEGESSITFAPPRLPVFVQLGYRRETFNLKKRQSGPWREEVSQIVFTLGLQHGLSPR